MQKLMLAGNQLRDLPGSLAGSPNLELLRLSPIVSRRFGFPERAAAACVAGLGGQSDRPGFGRPGGGRCGVG